VDPLPATVPGRLSPARPRNRPHQARAISTPRCGRSESVRRLLSAAAGIRPPFCRSRQPRSDPALPPPAGCPKLCRPGHPSVATGLKADQGRHPQPGGLPRRQSAGRRRNREGCRGRPFTWVKAATRAHPYQAGSGPQLSECRLVGGRVSVSQTLCSHGQAGAQMPAPAQWPPAPASGCERLTGGHKG